MLVIVLATAPLARAANCPQADISASASLVQDARSALLTIPAGADASTLLSREAGVAIIEMKSSLAAFVLAYMRCQPENVDADGIEVDLSRLGWARTDTPVTMGAARGGWELTFEVRRIDPGLLGITATFGIPCGTDTELMLFQHGDAGWTEIMRVASPPYRDSRKSYDRFDYAVSPPDADGRRFLAEKHLPTLCEAPLSDIAYSIRRPGPTARAPRTIFAGRHSLSVADDDFGSVSAGADEAEFRFHDREAGSAELEEYVLRYMVSGQTVTAVQNSPP
ncbi:MAG: hypothetical protein WDN01_17175 [Rhizomicrobium sp.]